MCASLARALGGDFPVFRFLCLLYLNLVTLSNRVIRMNHRSTKATCVKYSETDFFVNQNLWTSLDAGVLSFCYTYAMKTLYRPKKSGFTLVELMVVIAIIAILTGIIITNLVASKAKSRDAKRASDLSQIALAVEQYFDRCDQYPIPHNGVIDSTLLTQGPGVCPTNNNVQVTFSNFISKIPTDPSSGASYGYTTHGTPPSDYVLYTTFETGNSVMSQSPPNPSWFLSFSCLNPATTPQGSSNDYCVRPN